MVNAHALVGVLTAFLVSSVACKKEFDPRLLGPSRSEQVVSSQNSPTPEKPRATDTNMESGAGTADVRPSPPKLDEHNSGRWKALLVGIEDPLSVDLTSLAAAMALDSDVQFELRPVVLSRAGLWLPILRALPQQARAAYQESVLDAFESDPVSRVESLSVSITYQRKEAKKRTKQIAELNFFARTRAGLIRDLVRWAGHKVREVDPTKPQFESTFVLLEAMTEADFQAVKSSTKEILGTEMIDLGPHTTLVIERMVDGPSPTSTNVTGIQLLTRGGVVGTTKSFSSLEEGLDLLIRVLRRTNESKVADTNGRDDLLASGRVSTSEEDGWSAHFEARLDKQLSISGVYRPPSSRSADSVARELKDPKEVERSLRSVRPVLPRTAEAVASNARYVVEGAGIRFDLAVPVLDILADLGGASVAMPDQALRLGAGFDDSAIAGAANITAPKLGADDFSRQRGMVGQLQFMNAQNPRNVALRRWLEGEGTLRSFVEWTGAHFGRPIPVFAAECGGPNAFYIPSQRKIVICYELADDLIAKLRGLFKPDDLGSAVMGGLLFILIHEYGHALIHQLQLPATGREEDAVDQLATVALIGTGTKGIRYALAAMRWFDASEKLGYRVPYWDEHSANGVRAHEIACLVYGSDPQGLSLIAGSDWLPTRRARRCPAEFQKASAAWGQLLGTRRGQDDRIDAELGGIGLLGNEGKPNLAECRHIVGQWQLTTTVTTALKGGIGTHGYYRMRVAEDCDATFEKLGFNDVRFTPDRIQRGGGRMRRENGRWVVSIALQRDATADYTMEFSFNFEDRVEARWRYTGDSYRETGFAGTAEGVRL